MHNCGLSIGVPHERYRKREREWRQIVCVCVSKGERVCWRSYFYQCVCLFCEGSLSIREPKGSGGFRAENLTSP